MEKNVQRSGSPSEYGGTLEAIDLSDTIKVLTWNKRLLSCVGIWPLNVHDVLFLPSFLYMTLHCSLIFADFFDVTKSLENILASVSEIALFAMTLGKIAYCRINSRSMAELLTEIEEDFATEKYTTIEDRLIFWNYNRKSCRYISIAVPTMILSLLLYYTNNMLNGVKMAKDNSSMHVYLPHKARVFVDIHDTRIYYFFSLCQLEAIAIVIFGYVGLDCLFISLAFHITAQLRILRRSIKNVLENTENFRDNLKKLVIRHHRIIRLAEALENDFNVIIFQQIIGTVVHVFISIYNWTVLYVDGTVESLGLMCFIVYGFNTIGTLFVYCYIGECLINESVKFGEAFYHSEWCNISSADLKLVHICMVRARKPLQLTSGKFFVLSLCTFTDTLKATMGYFSVLKNFL